MQGALAGHATVHQGNVPLYDVQSKSGSGDAARIMCPKKGFEQILLFFFWYTDTIVFDHNGAQVITDFGIEFNKRILPGILYRI